MRLLNARSITLEFFSDDRDVPPYAVLSHTWGSDEVTFQDMQSPGQSYTSKSGFKKIKGCCSRALRDGFAFVWIDTCCIDKSSSAELSEAINSMFRWYRAAAVCYAYLADVPADRERNSEIFEDVYAAYRSCRWFTRGWTLQELLAPADVRFFDAGWNYIGTKITNTSAIEKITGIRARFLRDSKDLSTASVAQRMAWAAGRKTTRREDIAYCLLGIFGINMPLLYGEGDKAFVRLQEEIMRESDDQSLFAWGLGIPLDESPNEGGLFARSPDAFRHCGSITFWGQLSTGRPTHYFPTNKGLRIELPLVPAEADDDTAYAVLDCISDLKFVGLPLSRAYHDDVFQRTRGSVPRIIPARIRKTAISRTIYFQKNLPGNSVTMYFAISRVIITALTERAYRLVDAFPPHAVLKVDRDLIIWGDAERVVLLFQRGDDERHVVALMASSIYRPQESDLSRPVLERIECSLAPGTSRKRFLKLILKAGRSGIGKGLKFTNSVSIGGDVITTAVREKTPTGWTVAVEVDASTGTAPAAPWFPDADNSDSDDMERITMDAMAAMVHNTNRDFRRRQTWARQQRTPRTRRKAYAIVVTLAALACIGYWRWEALRSYLLGIFGKSSLYPFYISMGVIVVSSFSILAWRSLGRR